MQPLASAASASASGSAASASVSISRDLLMSQFWQNLQARLQPAVPKDSTADPGRKWLSGFFSTGSTQNPLDRPYEVSTIWSPVTGPDEAEPALSLVQPAGSRDTRRTAPDRRRAGARTGSARCAGRPAIRRRSSEAPQCDRTRGDRGSPGLRRRKAARDCRSGCWSGRYAAVWSAGSSKWSKAAAGHGLPATECCHTTPTSSPTRGRARCSRRRPSPGRRPPPAGPGAQACRRPGRSPSGPPRAPRSACS